MAGALDGLGYALTVPESWFEVELRPAWREQSARSLVAERLRDQPGLRPHRGAVVRALVETAQRAHAAGAVLAACLVHPAEAGPLTASVTVTLLPAPPRVGPTDGAAPTDPLADLADHLEAVPLPPGGDPTEDLWCDVGLVALDGAGTAARVHGVEDVVLPDGAGRVRTAFMRTFVPLPGRDVVLLVTAGSPVLPLADSWFDVFDAVTSTLRVFDTAPTEPGDREGATAPVAGSPS